MKDDKIFCECSINDFSTVTDDIGDFFENSKASKVFSEAGIKALENFDWRGSPVFWVGLAATVIWFISVIRGSSQDKFDVNIRKIMI